MQHRLIAGVVTIAGLLGPAYPPWRRPRDRPKRGRCRCQPEVGTAEAGVGPSGSRGHLDKRRHARRADVTPGAVWDAQSTSPTRSSRSARVSAARRVISTMRERADSRNEEGSRDFGYTSLVVDPADGRVPALTPDARARRPIPVQRRGSLQHRRGLQQLRPLHHARPGRLVAAGGLREWRANCRRPTLSSSPTRWCTTRESSRSTAGRTSAAASSS